jgi:ketose-bisphosphate aldolase
MPLVRFYEMKDDAKTGLYAVGYFESWNLESLLAVADAAEAQRSPVILGFSGIYLPHPDRIAKDPLAVYAAMALQVCRQLSVPVCLLFNESPNRQWVMDSIDAGFNLVMFSDENLPPEAQAVTVRHVADKAHSVGCAVEAEMNALPGVGGHLTAQPQDLRLTSPEQARGFVEQTGVDALAVNVGQLHLHGRQQVRLDLDRLERLSGTVNVPLVLHGASSIHREDLAAAIRLGVRKINVGSELKQTYYNALRAACMQTAADANPYDMIGSGLAADVLIAGRLAMQHKVEEYMRLFGSAGRAGGSP